MLALAVVAILAGLLTAAVIRWTTDAASLRRVQGRIYAHLLEFRLFFDEPGLIWRAQVALVRENLRMLQLLLLPALILAAPMAWLYLQLETIYGHRPLRAGEPAILSVQLTRPIGPSDRFALQGRGGVAVETPPVRVQEERQVSWRIRAVDGGAGRLQLSVNHWSMDADVARGEYPEVLSCRRYRALGEFVLHPEEPRLPQGDVEWMEIEYPDAGPAWVFWFVGISLAAALVAARWRGIPGSRRSNPQVRDAHVKS